MARKTTRGRRPLPEGQKRTETVAIRLRPVELGRLKDAADAAEKTITDYVRDLVLSSLKRES